MKKNGGLTVTKVYIKSMAKALINQIVMYASSAHLWLRKHSSERLKHSVETAYFSTLESRTRQEYSTTVHNNFLVIKTVPLFQKCMLGLPRYVMMKLPCRWQFQLQWLIRFMRCYSTSALRSSGGYYRADTPCWYFSRLNTHWNRKVVITSWLKRNSCCVGILRQQELKSGTGFLWNYSMKKKS